MFNCYALPLALFASVSQPVGRARLFFLFLLKIRILDTNYEKSATKALQKSMKIFQLLGALRELKISLRPHGL